MGELYRILRAHMDRWDTTEAKVAKRIGMTPQALNLWRHNPLRRVPDRAKLEAIAELTSVPYEQVLAAALTDAGYTEGTQASGGGSVYVLTRSQHPPVDVAARAGVPDTRAADAQDRDAETIDGEA